MGWSTTQQFGLTHHRRQLTSKGYSLVTPLTGDSCYLIDMDGRFVHRWSFQGFTPMKSELLENGHLLVMGVDGSVRTDSPAPKIGEPAEPFETRIRRLGANASALLEVDWDGVELWRYENIAIHHDFKRLKSGHTVLPVWVEMPEDLSKTVRGGTRLPKEKLPISLLGDDIIEIDADGSEVRRVETWKLFDPRKDPICPLEGRIEWTHANSIDVNTDGEILISCRNNSRVAVIDTDGEMIWKYGAPDTAHQHHATFLENGNVQIFDNGTHRVRGMPSSKVIEVDRGSNEVVWSYEGEPTAQFFSGHISGATRLLNQNTLICEGTSGRLLEVTRKGEVVWEWWNPIYNSRPSGEVMGWLFRAYRYAPDYPGLAGHDLAPAAMAELNRLHGFD